MTGDVDHVGHLEIESARFAAAVIAAPPDGPVPTCPEWNADDLLWHLAEVQWFWATIVHQSLNEPPPAGVRPQRPSSRSELKAFYDRVSAELVTALATTSPHDRVWTWSTDRTVGFVRRRQAHEALIHRIDAELIVGTRQPMDAQLSDDGIDEALRVMYGQIPGWATFAPTVPGSIRLRAADTGSTWLVHPGRFSGTDPADGSSVEEACLGVASDTGRSAEATLTGSAADLDCWLWRRPTVAPLERSGDQRSFDQLEAVIESGID